MLYKNAYIKHFLKQKINKKLVVEHGNIYKFMKMMYKIQCQKPSERKIKKQFQKPSERQIKQQCQKSSER